MPARTSVELHAGGCRLVEVDLPVRRRGPVAADARVRTFVSEVANTDDGVALANALLKLRDAQKLARQTWVTIWGLRSAQQFLRLPPARPADLEALARREARKDIAPFEAGGDVASVSVIVGGEVQVGSQRRREVTLVAVSTEEVRRRMQPLVDAGFVVDGVLTPALALTAVARAQRDILPGTAVACVALNARATCLAIVRDGVLLFAREMPWGHDGDSAPAALEALATRVASELKRSILYFKQTFRAPVESVLLCGDMANLRVLTGPLSEALGVAVKPLDSLVGIDAQALPEPSDRFRADVAGLRLAIATGSDLEPAANLLPTAIRLSRAARTQMMRLGAALAASVIVVLAGYVLAERMASNNREERLIVEQQLAALEPEARRLDQLRDAYNVATARQAALGAFDSQGPRLARVMEALSQATPDEILLTSVTANADGMTWRVTVDGVAITEDASSGQAAVNALIDRVSASPFVGPPVQPPSLRVVSGTGAVGTTTTPAPSPVLPDGMSGVQFVLQFQPAK
jgi:Tfp pilus assembly protein PilN